METTPRRPRAGRVAIIACVAMVTLVPAACSSSDGDSAADPSTTTTSASGDPGAGAGTAGTTRPSRPSAGAVDPVAVPPGYRALGDIDIDVGVAVPRSWEQVELSGDDVMEGAGAFDETDPDLAALLEQASGMIGNGTAVAAIERRGAGPSRVVVLSQLAVSLPSIPGAIVSQVQSSFEAVGATNITVDRISVPGLPPEVRALEVAATVPVSGRPTRVRTVLVPADRGIAVVTVRAPANISNVVIDSLAAR